MKRLLTTDGAQTENTKKNVFASNNYTPFPLIDANLMDQYYSRIFQCPFKSFRLFPYNIAGKLSQDIAILCVPPR
jgi:hypothetical protein